MRRVKRLALCLLLGSATVVFGQASMFQQTLTTSVKDPVVLKVSLAEGNLRIGYSRDGQVAVYASGKDASGKSLPIDFFKANLIVEQKGNQVWIEDAAGIGSGDAGLLALYSISYRIDVPYRTEVYSTVYGTGNQALIGVFGPAKLTSGAGDIEAMYIRFASLEASTGKGNISCSRVLQVNAETGEGNITLMEDGDSRAVVRKGRGKIEVAGARGRFAGSTDAGTLHVKAVLNGDWHLKSASGNIRVELPRKSNFEIEATSLSGEISIERDDMPKPNAEVHQVHEQVNGGGRRIAMSSVKGSIFVE